MTRDDQRYFELAMIFARIAFNVGFSPVGAVLVSDNGEVFSASSRREIGNAKHAELLVLAACQDNPPNPPSPLTLYSTLEPCIMCAGMATVMRVKRIAWLVDDVWAGASRVYNPDNPYIKARFPTMAKVTIPAFHQEAIKMWIDYLQRTGHSDAVQFMLGIGE